MNKQERIKISNEYEAVSLEHGRGWRIEYMPNPTLTNKLLQGSYPSLQQTKDHFAKWQQGRLRSRPRDSQGRFTN